MTTPHKPRGGRPMRDLSPDEVAEIVRRWKTKTESNTAIGLDFGISSGTVSRVCIKLGGETPKRKRRGWEVPASPPEPEPPRRGTVAFEFDGVPVYQDGDDMCLTDLWRSAGSPNYLRPAEWLRHRGKQFVGYVASVANPHNDAAVHGARGGKDRGSTWGNWHIAFAYAGDLSPALRMHVQEVYRAYMDGRLFADTTETETILDATQAAAVEQSPDLMMTISRLPATVVTEIELLLTRAGVIKRRNLTDKTKRQHIDTVAHFFGGMCPCCGRVKIVENGQVMPDGHFDHADNRGDPAPGKTWLVCAPCNSAFQNRPEFREAMKPFFTAYQMRRRAFVREPELPGFQ